MVSPDWRDKLRADVQVSSARAAANTYASARLDTPLRAAVALAARNRNLTEQAYIRRALIGFVAFDLHLPWSDAVDLDPRLSTADASGFSRRLRDEDGMRHGSFHIERLVMPPPPSARSRHHGGVRPGASG